LQDPPKFTQIGIFGLKTNHLAALISPTTDQPVPKKAYPVKKGRKKLSTSLAGLTDTIKPLNNLFRFR
jgi:hypothetical protein